MKEKSVLTHRRNSFLIYRFLFLQKECSLFIVTTQNETIHFQYFMIFPLSSVVSFFLLIFDHFMRSSSTAYLQFFSSCPAYFSLLAFFRLVFVKVLVLYIYLFITGVLNIVGLFLNYLTFSKNFILI